jgi:hypothetical protein
MGRQVGRLLIGVGAAHLVVGVIVFHTPLAAMFRDGFVNTVPLGADFDRQAAFWFLFASPVTFLLGHLTNRALARQDAQFVRVVGRNLLGMGIVGATVMPMSGFWLLLALAPLFLREARRLKGQTASALPDCPSVAAAESTE